MRSFFNKLGVLATAAALMLPVVANAAPPAIDPNYRMPNIYGQDAVDGAVGSFYMNQNQLAIRLTGRDYADHADPAGPESPHWLGSGMDLIEKTVNTLIINARYPATGALACAECDKLLRNWIDVILRRVFDGNPLTAVDYDTQSFLYVDTNHPAMLLPLAPVTATLTDINGDLDTESWEPSPIFTTCLPALPGFGDMCMNMYIVNIGTTGTVALNPAIYDSDTGVVVAGGAGTINDPSMPAIDFALYDPLNPSTTSHLFFAAKPNLTFDNEIEGCDTAEFIGQVNGNCDQSIYRDDDDGLYVEFELSNFSLDVLFEPPLTTAVTAETALLGCLNGTVQAGGIAGGTGTCGAAAGWAKAGNWYASAQTAGSWAQNITDMSDGATFTTDLFGNQYSFTLPTADLPIPGCPTLVGGDEYAAECDLSNYLKLNGTLLIPELKLAASLRIVSSYLDVNPYSLANPTGDMPVGPNATTDVINFGVVLQSVEVSTDILFVLNAGPYCEDDLNFTSNNAAHGFDAMGAFKSQTDNPNNCETPADNDGVANASDDSTYLKSEKFAAVISYIRAEITATMQDLFDPSDNPGYFFGPTRLMDIGSLLTDAIDWPLAGGTDYLYMLLSLDSGVDATGMTVGQTEFRTLDGNTAVPLGGPATYRGDPIEEFWADKSGIMMPFNSGFAFDWFSTPPTAVTPLRYQSCVTNEASYTGYVDGYTNSLNGGGVNTDNDNPTVSRPLPSLKTEWTGADALAAGLMDGTDDHSASFLDRKLPDANGLAPYSIPTTTTPYAGVATGAYAFGLGIHQNFLSKLLYEMVIKGLLCMEMDARAVDGDYAFSDGFGLLNTSLFGFMIPYLADNFPDADMSLRILPLLQDPNNLYWPSSAAPGANYASRISEAQSSGSAACILGGYPCETTVSNPIPRIIIGGINTFDALKGRYAGEITTTYLGPLWPDLSIVIPHLVMEFYVYDDTLGPDQKRRVFALDVGINVGLNIDIVQDPGVAGGTTFMDTADPNGVNSDANVIPPGQIGSNDFRRPAYTGTDFPIGCGVNVAYGCEVTGVPSRLVLFLGGIIDPEVNAVLVYDEVQNGVGTKVTNNEAFLTAGVTDPTLGIYQDSISNLLGLALSSEISLFAEIGFDPAAWLDIPIVLTIPYIGPSFVYQDIGGSLNGKDDDLGCDAPEGAGAPVAPGCPDPLHITVDRDVSDNDTNGFGDYLIAAVGVDITYVTSDYLFRLIDTFLEPAFYDCDSTTTVIDISCQTEYYQLGSFLDDLLAAPKAQSAALRLPNGYVSPETYIKGIRKAHGSETLIDFEGFHPSESAEQLTFAWRVDGGFWTPFVKWNNIRIPGLLEGKHVFEVKAKDSNGNVEWTPARLEFMVDSVAPKATILGDRVQTGDARFFVEVRDAQTLPEDVRVAYSVDGSEWSRYSYNKDIDLSVAAGRHTVNVRSIDEAGNVSLTSLNFSTQDGGFGCSVASSGSAADASLLLLLVPAIVMAIRRRRNA